MSFVRLFNDFTPTLALNEIIFVPLFTFIELSEHRIVETPLIPFIELTNSEGISLK
jgi:hypothetical protein